MASDLVLRSGYAVEVVESEEQSLLRLRAPDGRICLKITMTPSGPEVELSSTGLKIASEGNVCVECERFEIGTRGDIVLASGGDLRVQVAGDVDTEAFAQRHRALRGDFALKANDDVTLDGERVRLNSPQPLPPKEALANTSPPALVPAVEPITPIGRTEK